MLDSITTIHKKPFALHNSTSLTYAHTLTLEALGASLSRFSRNQEAKSPWCGDSDHPVTSAALEKPSQPEREMRRNSGKMGPNSTSPKICVHDLIRVLLFRAGDIKGRWICINTYCILEPQEPYGKERKAMKFPFPGKGQISKMTNKEVPKVGP